MRGIVHDIIYPMVEYVVPLLKGYMDNTRVTKSKENILLVVFDSLFIKPLIHICIHI